MTTGSVPPDSLRRRSLIYRKLVSSGGRFEALADAAVASGFGDDAEAELSAARHMAIADLSPLPRTGFKGRGTVEWLTAQGITVPSEPNRATRQTDGALAARLSQSEMLILGDLMAGGDTVARLGEAWRSAGIPPTTARGFPVPRQDSHCWYDVMGECAAAMFAKICGVDLRPSKFADGWIAQTSVARLSAIVVRHDLGGCPNFHLFADSASSAYLFDCLLDTMGEFQGRVVGLTATRRLLS